MNAAQHNMTCLERLSGVMLFSASAAFALLKSAVGGLPSYPNGISAGQQDTGARFQGRCDKRHLAAQLARAIG